MIFCAAALAIVLYVPLWRIELDAPQYPEGLSLLIYAGKLGGNVDIINGLNHYIGMKTLHAADFLEFTLLPYVIFFFALLSFGVGLMGKPKLLYAFFILFVTFGVIAMIDFWRWEYNYGHDLNPDAAIIVPGMAYQPPLIGFKQLLNFGTFSIPDIGGWLFIIVGLLSALCVWLTQKQIKKITLPSASARLLIFCFVILISACNTLAEPIKPGIDNCYFCKMTISDIRFGAELVTKKGRVYKFDDSYCMLSYLKTNALKSTEIKDTYLTNYSKDHQLLNVTTALLLQSNSVRGPMGGNLAAFKEVDSLKKTQKQQSGNEIHWNEIVKQ